MNDMNRVQYFGMVIVIFAQVICSMQMVPGWGIGQLELNPLVWIAIAALAGAVGGGLIGGRYFLPGAIGGFIANIGAMIALGALLWNVNETHTAILAIVGAVGALPGIGLGFGLRYLQDLVLPPEPGFMTQEQYPQGNFVAGPTPPGQIPQFRPQQGPGPNWPPQG